MVLNTQIGFVQFIEAKANRNLKLLKKFELKIILFSQIKRKETRIIFTRIQSQSPRVVRIRSANASGK